MTSIKLFSERNSPSLADRSIVRFNDEGNPLKMQFREVSSEGVSPLSIGPRTEKASEKVRDRVERILPYREEKIPLRFERSDRIPFGQSANQTSLSREPGKIIQFPAAQINVGGISVKEYKKKYGLRESPLHRVFRKNVKEPIGKGLMNAGDFLVKAEGQSYLDRFDMLRFKFSDKNNNYSRGIIPKPIRTPLSLLGTPAMGNIPSLLLKNTFIGKGITNYRKGRRGRVDATKKWLAKPFRRVTTKVSSKLPLHERRYEIVQKVRGVNDWISKGEQWAESLIAGGMSGVLARRKQKRAFRARQERLQMVAEKRESRR